MKNEKEGIIQQVTDMHSHLSGSNELTAENHHRDGGKDQLNVGNV